MRSVKCSKPMTTTIPPKSIETFEAGVSRIAVGKIGKSGGPLNFLLFLQVPYDSPRYTISLHRSTIIVRLDSSTLPPAEASVPDSIEDVDEMVAVILSGIARIDPKDAVMFSNNMQEAAVL